MAPQNQITKIAIVGATGNVGSQVIKYLLEGGRHDITAITRRGVGTTFAAGIKVIEVEYSDPPTLVSALQGHEALVINLSVRTPHDIQEKLVRAAAEAGVKWVIPNEWQVDFAGSGELGKDTCLDISLYAAHTLVESLGMNWVGLICGLWYQHSLAMPHAWGFDFAEKTATFFDDGNTKLTCSTWAQCGRAVAALFSLPLTDDDKRTSLAKWKNKQLYISSFTVSQREILASVLRVSGDKESDWKVQYEPSQLRRDRGREILETKGDLRGYVMAVYARVAYKDGGGEFTAKVENGLLGLAEEDLDGATREALEMVKGGYTYGK